jgi:hypothetical protein
MTNKSGGSSMSIPEHERLRALHLDLPMDWYTEWRLQGVPYSVLAWLGGGDEDFLLKYTALAKNISSEDLSFLATALLARNWQGYFYSEFSLGDRGRQLLLLALEIRNLGFSIKSTPDVLHTILNRVDTDPETGDIYSAVIAVVYLRKKAKILIPEATKIVSGWHLNIDEDGRSDALDRAKMWKTLTVDNGVDLETVYKFLEEERSDGLLRTMILKILVVDYGVPLETASDFLTDIPLELFQFEEEFLYFDAGKRSDPDDVFAELTAFSSIELCSRYVDEIAKILLSPKTRHWGAWHIYLTLLKLEGFKPLN